MAIQVQSWNHNTGVVLVLTNVVCPTFVKPLGTGKKTRLSHLHPVLKIGMKSYELDHLQKENHLNMEILVMFHVFPDGYTLHDLICTSLITPF